MSDDPKHIKKSTPWKKQERSRKWFGLLWILCSVIALAGIVTTIVMLSSHARGSQRGADELKAWFRSYQQNEREGKVDAVVAGIGPRTRAWEQRMIEAARSESAEQVLRRDFYDMLRIMDLRHRYSKRELDGLSVDDALRESKSNTPKANKSPFMELSEIRIDDQQATARIEIPDTPRPGTRTMVGEGQFFSRLENTWSFERHLFDKAIMDRTLQMMPKSARNHKKMVEDACAQTWGEPFDQSLWAAPRP